MYFGLFSLNTGLVRMYNQLIEGGDNGQEAYIKLKLKTFTAMD